MPKKNMSTGSITVTFPLPLTQEQQAAIGQLLGAEPAAAPARTRATKADKAEKAAEPAEPTMPAEEFQKELDVAVKALGAGAVKEVFTKFGAKKFSDLKPANYASVVAALKEAAASATADLTS